MTATNLVHWYSLNISLLLWSFSLPSLLGFKSTVCAVLAWSPKHGRSSSSAPPSFWHVPTRSTLCHGNRGWHHTFGRTVRWWWKSETVTVHWILCNQDPGDSTPHQVGEWKTENGGVFYSVSPFYVNKWIMNKIRSLQYRLDWLWALPTIILAEKPSL